MADFGYVWRDFDVLLNSAAFNSAVLTDLADMLDPSLSVNTPSGVFDNWFHVGMDFVDPNHVATQYPGGGDKYLQVGSTVSFNGRLERLSLVNAGMGPGSVPEPSGLALLAAASLAMVVTRPRKLA